MTTKPRSQRTYKHPIASRDDLLALVAASKPPVRRRHLAKALGYSQDSQAMVALKRRLEAMVRDGQLIFQRGGYALKASTERVEGRLSKHPHGFGFLTPASGGVDVFLPAHTCQGYLTGDTLLVDAMASSQPGKREGRVVSLVARDQQTVVGRLRREEGSWQVVPVRPDMRNMSLRLQCDTVPAEALPLEEGTYVQCRWLEAPQAPTQRRRPRQVDPLPVAWVRTLGLACPSRANEVLAAAYGLSNRWSEDVEAACALIEAPVEGATYHDREDWRTLPFVTIDGQTARDFDDAIFLAPRAKGAGWDLHVAIADVSHYVPQGSALDQLAQQRGNSTYFPGQVFPMLPPRLSDDVCSLRPNVDRLAMGVILSLDPEARLEGWRFTPAVICSKARLTYGQVQGWLEGHGHPPAWWQSTFDALRTLFPRWRSNRSAEGVLDLALDDVWASVEPISHDVLFTQDRSVDAHQLIEMCMVYANEAAARQLVNAGLPGLFRTHPLPPEDKWSTLMALLDPMGIDVPPMDLADDADPQQAGRPIRQACQALLKTLQAMPGRHPLQVQVLKRMAQATYSAEVSPHFGLALAQYTHFTSPIRRYTDLLVHRVIKAHVTQDGASLAALSDVDFELLGAHLTQTERTSDDASRAIQAWLKCWSMREQVGAWLDLHVMGINPAGLSVYWAEQGIEGWLPKEHLVNSTGRFDPLTQSWVTPSLTLRVGDPMRARLVRADLDSMDLLFDERPASPWTRRRRRRT